MTERKTYGLARCIPCDRAKQRSEAYARMIEKSFEETKKAVDSP